MDGDNIRMKLFGVSLQRNGAIENNNFAASIVWTPDANPAFINTYLFPVEIPAGTGSWFENVTTEQVDAAGYEVFGGPFDRHFNETAIPEYKYGYDPLWNVLDPNTYTYTDKQTEQTYTVLANETTFGFPKPSDLSEMIYAKSVCRLQSRLLAIYNDNPTEVTVKVRIADQSFKGAVTELINMTDQNDAYGLLDTGTGLGVLYPFENTTGPSLETDGADYSPANVKFKFQKGALGNTLPYIPEEMTYTIPAGGWAMAFMPMYVTKENGDYAGIDDDYLILATETQ